MTTKEAIFKRRSVREYTSKTIAKTDLIKIIDAARHAATARNEQPWEFVIVTDKAKITEIGKIASPNGDFIAQAQTVIAVVCLDNKYYLEDGCAATQNILLMATSIGIGSCWVAGDKKPYCADIKNLLYIPTKYKLVSLVALGYPKNKPRKVKKRGIKEITHWQGF